MTDIDFAELTSRLGEVALVDVRNAYEFDGSFGSPCDPRQGHIPGAVNLPLDELAELSAAELRERLALPEGAEIVAYCHSGSRSAFAVAILQRLGFEARNYVGSWHEWSRSGQPIEEGVGG